MKTKPNNSDIFINYFVIIANIIMALVPIIILFILPFTFENISYLGPIALLALIALCLIFWKRNFLIGKANLLLITFLAQPYRIITTGGIYSFAVGWQVPILMGVYWIFGIRLAVITYIYQALFALSFFFTQDALNVDAGLLLEKQTPRIIVEFAILTVSFVLIYLYDLKNKELSKGAQEAERKSTLLTLGVTLAHEINNPMAIVVAKFNRLKKKYDFNEDDTKMIEDGFKRITLTIKQIETLHDENEILTQEYAGNKETQLYVLDNKKKKD